MKHILFPTDFSENAAQAFDNLLKFTSGIDAEVDVIHVVSPDIEAADTPLMSGRMTIKKKEVAEEVIKTFINSGRQMVKEAKMVINAIVEIGAIVPTINHQLKEKKYDLLVLGTRGESKSKIEKWIGTTSTKIINNAHCHVMLIPTGYQFEGISQIAFASALHHGDPFVIWKVLKLISPYKPLIRWLHYMEDELAEEERISEFLTYFEDKPDDVQMSFHRVKGGDFSNELEVFIEKYHVDILVMVRQEKNIFDMILHKSHTIRMANELNVPLLVIRVNS